MRPVTASGASRLGRGLLACVVVIALAAIVACSSSPSAPAGAGSGASAESGAAAGEGTETSGRSGTTGGSSANDAGASSALGGSSDEPGATDGGAGPGSDGTGGDSGSGHSGGNTGGTPNSAGMGNNGGSAGMGNNGGTPNSAGMGNSGGSAGAATSGAVFDRGQDTILVTQIIGPDGGKLVGPDGSPIAGVTVTFSKNALTTDTSISLGFNDGVLRNTAGQWSGVNLVLNSAGATVFDQPVTFELPGFGTSDIVLPYFIDETNVLAPIGLAPVDEITGVASFQTFHTSTYSSTKLPPGTCNQLLSESVNTGFKPSQNGFMFENTTSDFGSLPQDQVKGGLCRGMVFYSLWAFEHPAAVGASLAKDHDLECERKVAMDAHNQVSNRWVERLDSAGGIPWLRSHLGNQFCALAAALKDGAPVPLSLSNTATDEHAVLVTGYSPGAGRLDSTGQKCDGIAVNIYDPNFKQNDNRFICYDLKSESWQPYNANAVRPFTNFWVTGTGFVNPNFSAWSKNWICMRAMATGDPHLSTYDGVHYDFQRVGEFVLAQTESGLDVQVRLGSFADSHTIATVIAVAAKIGTDRVEINARGASGQELWINDALAAPQTLPSGVTVSLAGFTWPDGTQLAVSNLGGRLDVQLHGLAQAGLRGLLGNSNADLDDEFQLRDGTRLARPLDQAGWASFTNAWRITNAESAFHYAQGEDTSTFTDLTFPSAIATARGLAPTDYASAKDICLAAGISEASQAVLEDCILDVATTGDASFATSAALMPQPTSVEAEICPGATVGAAVPLTNGDFETPHLSGANWQTLSTGSTVLSGWAVEGQIDMTYGTFWQHAHGTQSVDVNGTARGSLTQSFTTVPGQSYAVSFSLAGNPYCAPTFKLLEVEAANQRGSYQFDITGHSFPDMGWQPARFLFRAVSTTTQLTFRSLVDGSCGPAIDNVEINELDCPGG